MQYQDVNYEGFMVKDSQWYRVTFSEYKYDAAIQEFCVGPYLSAYMLGYSKMLMQSFFQFVVEIGGTPLYTDTDSVVACLTAKQKEIFCARWVPPVKHSEA